MTLWAASGKREGPTKSGEAMKGEESKWRNGELEIE